MRWVLPLAMLAAGSPALAADQFDLACQGTKWTQRGAAGDPYSFRARIDLKAGKWCDGDCKAARPIFKVSDDKLVLTDEGTLNSRMEVSHEVTFDRKKNVFIDYLNQVRPTEQLLYVEATCTSEAFTPLPG